MKKFLNFFDSLNSYAIVLCLGTMLVLSCLGIFLRWFQISFLWIDPLNRHLVLALAFLGGIQAVAKQKHIKIDALEVLFSHKKDSLRWLERTLQFLTASGIFLLAYAGYQYFQVELEYGKEEFLGLHSALLVSIIPFGFCLMGLRQLFQIFMFESKTREG